MKVSIELVNGAKIERDGSDFDTFGRISRNRATGRRMRSMERAGLAGRDVIDRITGEVIANAGEWVSATFEGKPSWVDITGHQ